MQERIQTHARVRVKQKVYQRRSITVDKSMVSSQRQRVRLRETTERETATVRKDTERGIQFIYRSLVSVNYSLKTFFTHFPLMVWAYSVERMSL